VEHLSYKRETRDFSKILQPVVNSIKCLWLPHLRFFQHTAKVAKNAMISHQNWQELAMCQIPAPNTTFELNTQNSLLELFYLLKKIS